MKKILAFVLALLMMTASVVAFADGLDVHELLPGFDDGGGGLSRQGIARSAGHGNLSADLPERREGGDPDLGPLGLAPSEDVAKITTAACMRSFQSSPKPHGHPTVAQTG